MIVYGRPASGKSTFIRYNFPGRRCVRTNDMTAIKHIKEPFVVETQVNPHGHEFSECQEEVFFLEI